jgi:hypothetical protein
MSSGRLISPLSPLEQLQGLRVRRLGPGRSRASSAGIAGRSWSGIGAGVARSSCRFRSSSLFRFTPVLLTLCKPTQPPMRRRCVTVLIILKKKFSLCCNKLSMQNKQLFSESIEYLDQLKKIPHK